MDIFIDLEVDGQIILLQKDSRLISLLKNFVCTSDILHLAIVIMKQFTFAWQVTACNLQQLY